MRFFLTFLAFASSAVIEVSAQKASNTIAANIAAVNSGNANKQYKLTDLQRIASSIDGIGQILGGKKKVTLFAPVDSAVEALKKAHSPDKVKAVEGDKQLLRDVLTCK